MSNDVKSLLRAHAPRAIRQSRFYVTFEEHIGEGVPFPKEHEFIEKHGDYEYWSNVPIKTSKKIGPQQAWCFDCRNSVLCRNSCVNLIMGIDNAFTNVMLAK